METMPTSPVAAIVESCQALFDDLRHDRIRPALRLEQERIGFRWVETALARLP